MANRIGFTLMQLPSPSTGEILLAGAKCQCPTANTTSSTVTPKLGGGDPAMTSSVVSLRFLADRGYRCDQIDPQDARTCPQRDESKRRFLSLRWWDPPPSLSLCPLSPIPKKDISTQRARNTTVRGSNVVSNNRGISARLVRRS